MIISTLASLLLAAPADRSLLPVASTAEKDAVQHLRAIVAGRPAGSLQAAMRRVLALKPARDELDEALIGAFHAEATSSCRHGASGHNVALLARPTSKGNAFALPNGVSPNCLLLQTDPYSDLIGSRTPGNRTSSMAQRANITANKVKSTSLLHLLSLPPSDEPLCGFTVWTPTSEVMFTANEDETLPETSEKTKCPWDREGGSDFYNGLYGKEDDDPPAYQLGKRMHGPCHCSKGGGYCDPCGLGPKKDEIMALWCSWGSSASDWKPMIAVQYSFNNWMFTEVDLSAGNTISGTGPPNGMKADSCNEVRGTRQRLPVVMQVPPISASPDPNLIPFVLFERADKGEEACAASRLDRGWGILRSHPRHAVPSDGGCQVS